MKEKVDVTGVPETMLQTLYARAKETKKSEMSWPVETVSGKCFIWTARIVRRQMQHRKIRRKKVPAEQVIPVETVC